METVVFKTEDYFNRLGRDIAQAQNTIEIETYIFSKDRIGSKFATLLASAAKRGVKVRLIVDGFGSPFFGGETGQKLREAGVEYRIFRPIPWHFWQWKHSLLQKSWIQKPLYFFSRANRRNHKKVILIDQKIAWVGSFNVSLTHFPFNQGGEGWKDAAVRVDDQRVRILRSAFDDLWFGRWLHTNYRETIKALTQVRITQTMQYRRILRKDMLRRLNAAKKRVWITNAYFVPDYRLLNALKDAAERGVDVRIILPKRSDIFIIPWITAIFYEELLRAGVRLFELESHVLHAKTLILDSWTTVGSTNFNHRSFLHDMEVDLVLQEKASMTKVETEFLTDIDHSQEILLKNWKGCRPLQRLLGKLLLLFRYYL